MLGTPVKLKFRFVCVTFFVRYVDITWSGVQFVLETTFTIETGNKLMTDKIDPTLPRMNFLFTLKLHGK